jgi:uracil-DNA glycosylase
MDERLRKEVANWLEFYRDMGIRELDLRRSEPTAGDVAAQSATPSLKEPVLPLPGQGGAPKQWEAPKELPSLKTIHSFPGGPPPKSLSLFEASPSAPRGKETLEGIREDLGDCHRCRLSSGRKTIVFGQGNPHAEVVFVGEGPGADEDVQGLPFVGRAGQLLNRMIQLVGMKREEVYICNVVKCRPPGNRTPLPDEIETCSPFLLRQIQAIGPRLVCCLGAPAVRTVLGVKEGITKIRGRFYDFGEMKALATVHPAYILRNPREEKLLREDFERIHEFLRSSR